MRKHGVYYDSRIKLLLILLTSALAFALGGGLTGLLLFGVVCLFALLSGLWKTSIKFAIVYIVLLVLAQVLPIHLSSVITFFLLRILTIALALNILFQTTEISELIAALQASHIPQAIVIPVAIILRFLPSLKQDVLYIKQGMKTSGVVFLENSKSSGADIRRLFNPYTYAPSDDGDRIIRISGNARHQLSL